MLVGWDDFIAAFPEFTDYSADVFNFWEGEGEALYTDRYGDRRRTAIMLYCAHNLVLQKRAQIAADAGATPGIAEGIVTSKSVGSVSKSMDLSSSTVEGAENYNLTTYGQRLYRLVRTFGSGPLYVRRGGSVRMPF